jgi:hypothetical protein
MVLLDIGDLAQFTNGFTVTVSVVPITVCVKAPEPEIKDIAVIPDITDIPVIAEIEEPEAPTPIEPKTKPVPVKITEPTKRPTMVDSNKWVNGVKGNIKIRWFEDSEGLHLRDQFAKVVVHTTWEQVNELVPLPEGNIQDIVHDLFENYSKRALLRGFVKAVKEGKLQMPGKSETEEIKLVDQEPKITESPVKSTVMNFKAISTGIQRNGFNELIGDAGISFKADGLRVQVKNEKGEIALTSESDIKQLISMQDKDKRIWLAEHYRNNVSKIQVMGQFIEVCRSVWGN